MSRNSGKTAITISQSQSNSPTPGYNLGCNQKVQLLQPLNPETMSGLNLANLPFKSAPSAALELNGRCIMWFSGLHRKRSWVWIHWLGPFSAEFACCPCDSECSRFLQQSKDVHIKFWFVSLSVLPLWQISNLFMVSSNSCPMTSWIGSTSARNSLEWKFPTWRQCIGLEW